MITIRNRKFGSASEFDDIAFPVHLINCTLDRLDLSRFDFSGSIFDASSLRRTRIFKAVDARFFSCDLTHTDFSGADIRGIVPINCKADGLELTGAHLTFSCGLFAGLHSDNPVDVWKLLTLVLLLNSPEADKFKIIISDHIPQEARLLLTRAFERDPS